MITSIELRKKYISFFKSKNHVEILSASLIPENDPTVLFTTAGMHPLVPYLLGEKHPLGKKLCNIQKCIRTGDIDEVGDDWHLSFFEMMGHWSLGDYFKKEAIEMSFEFLTSKKYLGIPIERLSVTCFEGDNDAPQDLEASEAWEKCGIPKKRIHFLPKKDNWWGPAGLTGPCGPDTEFFYHVKNIQEKDTKEFEKFNKQGIFCEIGNDVLMQYNKNSNGFFETAKQKNIDNGTGLERLTAVLNGFDNVYEIDSIKPIFEKVLELSNLKRKKRGELNNNEKRSVRIITDHLRASVMILGDDKAVTPSNVDQGYILRRFIRRSIRHGRLIGIKENFCNKVAGIVVKEMSPVYNEIEKNKEFIFNALEKEEEKFSKTIEAGIKILEKKLFFLEKSNIKELNAKGAFDLFQSYGFPLEMTIEICEEKGFRVDEKGFQKLLLEHQELSRKGAEQKFKGGLADSKEETTKLHTCAHLTLAALKEILDKKIEQKGSNINSERLRFDFNFDRKLTTQEIKKIEEWVNNAIKSKAIVKMEILSLEEAKKNGAHGSFESKYGEKVKVYTIIGTNGKIYSKEICGGPHTTTLENIGDYKIIKEESSSAGVRRIKAVLK